jgi:hypothetical protein
MLYLASSFDKSHVMHNVLRQAKTVLISCLEIDGRALKYRPLADVVPPSVFVTYVTRRRAQHSATVTNRCRPPDLRRRAELCRKQSSRLPRQPSSVRLTSSFWPIATITQIELSGLRPSICDLCCMQSVRESGLRISGFRCYRP